MTPSPTLRAVKLLHTLIWAFFAGCIVAIPLATLAGRFSLSALLIGVVTLECLIIVFNKGRCPLTDVAARYTDERRANFDIYLPLWLARHNKALFGALFALGVLQTLLTWLKGFSAA